MIPVDGGKKEEHLSGYKEKIESKDIVSFSYKGIDFIVKCEKEDNILHIESKGGNVYDRDGTYFVLDYNSDDLSFLKTLQKIVEDDDIAKENGHVVEVAGLPEGIGDTISIEYQSGETIYKSSNQAMTISEEASKHIYEAFHKMAVDNGLDFNSEESNVQLYDDADNVFLQGIWSGKHFGREFVVEFEGNRIKIYCDGELTDDCEYVIYEGSVRKNQLVEGKSSANSSYDYQEFSEISCFRKSNDFTIVAYFMKGSYSTDTLFKQ